MPTENENAQGSASAKPLNFPNYQPGNVEVADPKYHAPLYKLMRNMMRLGKNQSKPGKAGKVKAPGKAKGLTSNQSIHVVKRKRTYGN